MNRTPQHAYASSLLREQNFGYPLRNPRPNDKADLEGFQIGDVGHVDENGRFHPVLNIGSPPKELQGQIQRFHFVPPVGELAFKPKKVFMAGVKRTLEQPRVDYAFTMTSNEGAILILPDGACQFGSEDKGLLEKMQEYAKEYALQMCRFAKQDTLYLITAVFKSKSWILGSFHNGSHGDKILVYRKPCDSSNSTATFMYEWECETNLDDQEGPHNNPYMNQAVLIKGFRMTVRWDWLPIVERAERVDWWLACFLASLWSTVSRWWLGRVAIDYIPFLNLSQPHHPLDIINRVLLEKNPGAQVAITHDDDWIRMLERGLPSADLMQEDHLREFMVQEQPMWGLDSERNAVYLRNNHENADDEHEPARGSVSRSWSGNPRLVTLNIRLEDFEIDCVYAGICILVQYGCTTMRTKNKPHTGVTEWDDEFMLPSDGPVSVTVCGVFQLGSTLGTRKIFTKQINTSDLSDDAHMIKLSVGDAGSSSLLLVLGRYFSRFSTFSSFEEESDFVEKTNSGFDALYSYHDHPINEHLECALQFFRCALECCGIDSDCRAAALFNLATSQLIKCQIHGAYSGLSEPIGLYEEALTLRGPGHPDRPATLLLLAQALLSRLGQEYNEFIATQIQQLLAEIHPEDSRNRRTADVTVRTCRFYQGVNANVLQFNDLLGDLTCSAYVPPYGYFDRPHILHKIAVALLERFEYNMCLDDMDKSISLNQEALHLIPDGHEDQASIGACLGRSFLRRIECGGLVDVDMSVDLVELGERVIMVLKNMSYGLLSEELQNQIALISTAGTALRHIVQEVPSPHTPEILVDEWNNKNGIPTRCKKQLAILLSFLGGEGEVKMREMLVKVDWPFKEYKIKETVEGLRNYLPYFHDTFTTKLPAALATTVLINGTVDDVLAVAAKVKLSKFHVFRAMCDDLVRRKHIEEAITCFKRMRDELAEDMRFHDEQMHWEDEFRRRCGETLEKLGDAPVDPENYDGTAEEIIDATDSVAHPTGETVDTIPQVRQLDTSPHHTTLHMSTGLPTRHVVFIGETGSGKSSVINLVADRNCAPVSPSAEPCTRDFASYEVIVNERSYTLWDTPVTNPGTSIFRRLTRRDSLKRFLQERYRLKELDLIVLCVRASRALEGMSRVYQVFCRGYRQLAIPVVIAITHLERVQPTMDAWWKDNERKLAELGLVFDGHACLTCLPSHHRRWASQQDIRVLISADYKKLGAVAVDATDRVAHSTGEAVSTIPQVRQLDTSPHHTTLYMSTGLPTRHVVFIGETGSGKSSIINLVADRNCAPVSSDAEPCTRDFAPYEVMFDGRGYTLWDTPAINPGTSIFRRLTRSDSLKRFLQERYRLKELDLIVLCVRASRALEGMSRVYEVFCRESRQLAIPVVISITHLERMQPTMEAWWQNNERRLGGLGLVFDGHACLTCLPSHHRRWASQQDIRFLISAEHQTRAQSSLEVLIGGPACVVC